MNGNLIHIDEQGLFLTALRKIIDPEQNRQIVD